MVVRVVVNFTEKETEMSTSRLSAEPSDELAWGDKLPAANLIDLPDKGVRSVVDREPRLWRR